VWVKKISLGGAKMLKFTVNKKELQEALKTLDGVKHFTALFFDVNDRTVRVWIRDYKKDIVFSYEINITEIERIKPIGWFAVDRDKIKLLKKAIRKAKEDFITVILKENDKYLERLPRQLRHKLIINNVEIEIT
jgi:hypothetical protein